MLNKKRAKTLINFCIMPEVNKCKEIFGEIEKSNKIYSTVDLDCDLEKISSKLKFGKDFPYTFRIHKKKQKKTTYSTLGTAKIHNNRFKSFCLHFNVKNHKNIILYVILCANIRFCFECLLLSFECQYSNQMLWF